MAHIQRKSVLIVVMALMIAGCSAAKTTGPPVAQTGTRVSAQTRTVVSSPSTAKTSTRPLPAPITQSRGGAGADGAPPDFTPTPTPDQNLINGWVAQFSNGVKFIGWTTVGQQVSGTYHETIILPAATNYTSNDFSFQGSISGQSVTLTFSQGFGSTISGQLDGATLSLSFPLADGSIQTQVFHPGTTADYNAGVALVQQETASRQAISASIASSQASVAQQQAAARQAQNKAATDQQNEQGAIAALARDANFDSDLSSLSNDVKQTASDLAQTRTDAKAGGGDQCVNASSTVYNDAATTVFNDAQTTLLNDALALSRDIQSAQDDIVNVRNATQQLVSDGLAASDAASAISAAAQSAITGAKATANGDIDTINADVSTAYSVANSATGACAGMGPNKPPAPIPHV